MTGALPKLFYFSKNGVTKQAPEEIHIVEGDFMTQLSIAPKSLASCTETELRNILSDLILAEDCSDAVLNRIDVCLAELNRRFPVTPSITAEESLRNFHQKHPEVFEDR